MDISRFDVCLINADPVMNSGVRNVSTALIISPDSMNNSTLGTVLIAPMTTKSNATLPTRITIEFNDKTGQIALDQLRVIERKRLIKNLGKANKKTQNDVLHILHTLFAK